MIHHVTWHDVEQEREKERDGHDTWYIQHTHTHTHTHMIEHDVEHTTNSTHDVESLEQPNKIWRYQYACIAHMSCMSALWREQDADHISDAKFPYRWQCMYMHGYAVCDAAHDVCS